MSKRFGSAQHILVATQLREGETVAAPPAPALAASRRPASR